MKQLACEMCGGTNVIKQDGLFICQTCGIKYSVEEVRKMMTGETVEVKGTIKIDQSQELKNLYEVARRAKNTGNASNALMYYNQILIKDPNSWEAQFYVIYYGALQCQIEEITFAVVSINNCISEVLNLVNDNVPEKERKEVISEIYFKLTDISNILFDASKNHYEYNAYNIREDFTQNHVNAVLNILNLNYIFADELINKFGEEFSDFAASSWIMGIFREVYVLEFLDTYSKSSHKFNILNYTKKIRVYDSEYISPLEEDYINKISIFKSSKCPFCKSRLSSDTKFCIECGARVNR